MGTIPTTTGGVDTFHHGIVCNKIVAVKEEKNEKKERGKRSGKRRGKKKKPLQAYASSTILSISDHELPKSKPVVGRSYRRHLCLCLCLRCLEIWGLRLWDWFGIWGGLCGHGTRTCVEKERESVCVAGEGSFLKLGLELNWYL